MVYTEVENKDFKRVQKLIDTNDDGSKMCKLIKDSSKAIRRYVAGRILTGEGALSIEDYRKKNFGRFSSFANRAIELNGTYFDIIVTFLKKDDIDNVVDWLIDDKGFDSAVDKAQEKSGNTSKADKKDKAELETMKKKFTTMLKSVLYSCICMNNIPEDIMNYIELVRSDSECEQIAKDFKINVDELSDIISRMNDAEIMQINMLIYQLKCLLDDKNIPAIQRVQNAISKLGKLDKSEVVTGSDLVNKMLDKLGDRDMSGKSILEVNSKYGEFLIQIYERYGKEVANNVKVVASSDITKNFIRKVLNILELDEYNLIELEDYNGNGIYDIKDFVEASNEKILKYNNMKKWDVCLMNPPYGAKGEKDLHYRFTEKCINMCDDVICVMPFTLINSKGDVNEKYRKILQCSLIEAEELNASEYFGDTEQLNIGVYQFNKNKVSKDINIIFLNKKDVYTTETLDIPLFSEYESQFTTLLQPALIPDVQIRWNEYIDHPERHVERISKKYNIQNPSLQDVIKKLREERVQSLPDNKIYLNTNAVTGNKPNGLYIFNTTGRIFQNKDEVLSYLNKMNTSVGYMFISFDTVNEAKNCKISLQNPLLRFVLLKQQEQAGRMMKTCYQYVPNIDWSDPRVVTDEGLLEICGCPKDKCKEYAEYCRKYMEEFDKQHQLKKKIKIKKQ